MGDCTDCKYRENMCKWPCYDCVKGDMWEEMSFTNGDRIRAMTDEELAEWGCTLPVCPPGPDLTELCYSEAHPNRSRCCKCWKDWLGQEAKE